MSDEQIVDDLTKPYLIVVNFIYDKFGQYHDYVLASRKFISSLDPDPDNKSVLNSFAEHKTFFDGDARIHRVFLLTFVNDLALATQILLQLPQNEYVKEVFLVDLRDPQQKEKVKQILASEIPNDH